MSAMLQGLGTNLVAKIVVGVVFLIIVIIGLWLFRWTICSVVVSPTGPEISFCPPSETSTASLLSTQPSVNIEPPQQQAQQDNSHTCITSQYTSLGNNWVGSVEEQVTRGAIKTYSHCPPGNTIRYTKIAADDELSTVELVCASSTTDITSKFSLLNTPNELLPHYESQTINVPEGCLINMTVTDARGVYIGLTFQATAP